MSIILVFTNNNLLKNAINSLIEGQREVFFFTNRLQFLVCTSLINKSVNLIDTTGPDMEDVRWLIGKMRMRGSLRRTHYISPAKEIGNTYIRKLRTITNIAELKRACIFGPSVKSEIVQNSLEDILLEKVKRKVSSNDFEFLEKIVLVKNNAKISISKSDASRRYYIRKKLSLETLLEFNQLFQMISVVWNCSEDTCIDNTNKIEKKVIWRTTNVRLPA